MNDPDFQTWRMPNLDQLKAFTQFTGSAMDRGAMTASLSASASASASASSTGSAKKRRRKKWRFHSNDTRKDEMYLKWPLTLENINDYSQRRNKAYLRALDLKGSNDRTAKTYFKKVLQDFVEKAGGTCTRPITAPNGLEWSEWFTDQQ